MTPADSSSSFDREILLDFVETKWFTRDWDGLGLNDEADLFALQTTIMLAPIRWPVIAGTGGLRKMRFAPPSWSIGKRGALRVCYVYYPEYGHVLLVVVYPKGVQDDLTEQEKKECRRIIEEHRQLLSQSYNS